MNPTSTSIPALLAAALPDHPRLLDTIGYQLTGLMVVFIALGLIWGMLEIMGFVFRRSLRTAVTLPVPVPEPKQVGAGNEEIPADLVAAISAAVEVALEAPHRIEAIVPAAPMMDLDWAQEGRRQIFASHKTR